MPFFLWRADVVNMWVKGKVALVINDHHNGNWYCHQCDEPRYGGGLGLVARTKVISITEAAKVVADALPLPEPKLARKTREDKRSASAWF
ncbi:hypothetical protein [Xenorhabdus bovienii]|uniref:hypothetical protein n=1 Tax=Xenorhabdus bovienii TaxID=40576 RepID=UPI002A668B42|nr:hypothetical protein [Xenorhabdus bovienii]MDE9441282.1 hypothetical protein [Xenorhabdus bovienii]